MSAALLALWAGLWYGIGWAAGRAVAFALWTWAALRQGYKDGL